MSISGIVDYFIHDRYFKNRKSLQQARLLVRASLLTSLFSNSYVWLSVIFEYPKGVYLMIMNVLGFLLLPFLVKTRIRLEIVGNLFVLIGGFAVIVLSFYSGGIASGIYPWILSIPVLAMLVVSRRSSIYWLIVSIVVMLYYGWLALTGYEFPVEYDTENHVIWYVTILVGLVGIVYVITYVFASMRASVISYLEQQNQEINTERQRVADQSERLATIVEEKDQIIRMLAHDISNALNVVGGSLDLLRKGSLSNEESEIVENATSSTKNAKELVRKAMGIGKLEKQSVHVNLEEINIRQLIIETIKLYEAAAGEKKVQFQNRIPKDHFVIADKTYLKQVIDNLISNALKYSEKDEWIRCESSEFDHMVKIEIMDRGKGIPQSELKDLFIPYSKISTIPTAGESSHGIGLSLVKYYAELMGGSVSCESKEGEGSIFALSLPKSQMSIY